MKFIRDFLIFFIVIFVAAEIMMYYIANLPGIGPIGMRLFDKWWIVSIFMAVWVGLLMSISNSNGRMYKQQAENLKQKRLKELQSYKDERNKNISQEIIIKTKVPNKWRFVDLENNQTYKFENGKFVLVKGNK